MAKKEKQQLFEKQARIAAALAHPLRIAILDFLKSGPQCVCDIAAQVGSERSNISRHLAILISAGLLENRKEGLNVIYELKAPCVLDFFNCINTCLKEELKSNEKLLKII